MSVVYAWLRRHPVLVDSTLAFAVLLTGLPAVLGTGHWRVAPFVLLMTVPVAFRRRNPAAAFLIGGIGTAALLLSRVGPTPAVMAMAVLLYTLAAYRPRRQSVAGLLACLAGAAVAVTFWEGLPSSPDQRGGFISIMIVFGLAALIAWVLGDSMHYRRAYYLALEDRAARLERERDAQAQIAVSAERARIARELHDVVAHNVSVMVVQADGAGYALDPDPERARQALAAISATGRQALAEMRHLLGVLRSGDEQADLAPVPGIDQLRDLLEQTRAAGRTVSFTLDGAVRPLPEGVGLAAYRVVQEALTNVRKHGGIGASVCVALRYSEHELGVQVTDDGYGTSAADDGAGLGLTGMRERVGIYCGTVDAGPRPAGGYRVSVTLPLREAPAPATAPAAGAPAAALPVAAAPLALPGPAPAPGLPVALRRPPAAARPEVAQ
jgi:signal transduction histidine kinase